MLPSGQASAPWLVASLQVRASWFEVAIGLSASFTALLGTLLRSPESIKYFIFYMTVRNQPCPSRSIRRLNLSRVDDIWHGMVRRLRCGLCASVALGNGASGLWQRCIVFAE